MSDYEDEIVTRIGKCQAVINDLDNSEAWKVIRADLELQREQLDSNWQDIYESEKLQRARELKNAVKHLLSLKSAYEQELQALQRELHLSQNPEEEVAKDYDNETNYEE